MTEALFVLCDAEGTRRHGWDRPLTDLPGSWATVTYRHRDGTTRTGHLCPTHQEARLEGETGGTGSRLCLTGHDTCLCRRPLGHGQLTHECSCGRSWMPLDG
ncbi:MAG TPA: hypothetical protein VIL55_11315 [Naasia sp.]